MLSPKNCKLSKESQLLGVSGIERYILSDTNHISTPASTNAGYGIWYAVDQTNDKCLFAIKNTLRDFVVIHNDGFSFSCWANWTDIIPSDQDADGYILFIPLTI